MVEVSGLIRRLSSRIERQVISMFIGIFVIFFFFGAESESEEEESDDDDDDEEEGEATGGVGLDALGRFLVWRVLPSWSLSENRSDFEVPIVMLSVGLKKKKIVTSFWNGILIFFMVDRLILSLECRKIDNFSE